MLADSRLLRGAGAQPARRAAPGRRLQRGTEHGRERGAGRLGRAQAHEVRRAAQGRGRAGATARAPRDAYEHGEPRGRDRVGLGRSGCRR